VDFQKTAAITTKTPRAAPNPHQNFSLDPLRGEFASVGGTSGGSTRRFDLLSLSAKSTVATRPRAPTTSRATMLFSTFALVASANAWTVGQSRPVDAFWVSSGPAACWQARTAVS
jgi:hypothetical protein